MRKRGERTIGVGYRDEADDIIGTSLERKQKNNKRKRVQGNRPNQEPQDPIESTA
jgi:hypothetical protein